MVITVVPSPALALCQWKLPLWNLLVELKLPLKHGVVNHNEDISALEIGNNSTKMLPPPSSYLCCKVFIKEVCGNTFYF